MHVQQPFLAPGGNSQLPAARCGVGGTTHVEKSGLAQLFFTWHDSTRLKKAEKCSAFAKNASTRANIGQLGWLGAFACPLVSWARAPPGWAGPRGHSLAIESLALGPALAKNAVHQPKTPAAGPMLAGPSSWGLRVARG